MNVTFNLMGGGELNIPPRAISGFYTIGRFLDYLLIN